MVHLMGKRPARQVAALCFRKRKNGVEVLLITSRETRRWVVPKGWPMPPLKDYTAARREAFEEAGVEGHVRRKKLGSFSYAKLRLKDSVAIRVDVYLLEVERVRKSWPEMGERKRRWCDVETALHRIQEPELKKLIRSLEK
jgi:8-oxo-dGTP pyrophosphatase MutT (NUDIX family)